MKTLSKKIKTAPGGVGGAKVGVGGVLDIFIFSLVGLQVTKRKPVYQVPWKRFVWGWWVPTHYCVTPASCLGLVGL